jgi:outer membrane protein assembly factor BamB
VNKPLVIGTNGHVAAFDLASGQELWRTKLGGFFSATGQSDVAVLIQEDKVMAGCQGHLFCLALEDGKILWNNELSGLGYNDISLAVDNISIQYLQKVVRNNSAAST